MRLTIDNLQINDYVTHVVQDGVSAGIGMHCVMETEAFARQAVLVGLSEEDRHRIAKMLSDDPTLGVLIPGTGGARKLRYAKNGAGKSGGYRIITYYAGDDVPVFLLDVLDKGERLTLSQKEKNELRKWLGRIADDYREGSRERVIQLAGIA